MYVFSGILKTNCFGLFVSYLCCVSPNLKLTQKYDPNSDFNSKATMTFSNMGFNADTVFN